MPYTIANRVQETTSTAGTGTITLNGAIAGFQTFNSGIGTGNTTSYVIYDPTANVWEAGIGTVTAGSPNTLARTQVLSNSSGTTALISFAGNTSNVWCDYLAERSVTQFDVGTQANQIPLNQYLGTMAWQDVVNYKLNFVINTDVGTAPNQVPLNQYLGSMAYQDAKSYLTNQTVTNQFSIQPAITTLTATATLTIAQLLTYIVQVTSATAVTLTLPTGTLTDAGVLGGGGLLNTSFQWQIINTGSASGAITMTAGTAHTYVGNATVAINTSANFRTVKTASNTFVTYRIA